MSAGASDWYETTLEELGRVVTGSTPSTQRPEFYGGNYPFITPTDMEYGSRVARAARFLSEAGRQKLSSRLLPSETVCFTSIGATIGKMCMTRRPSFTNQQINSIVVDTTAHDARFVYYLLTQISEEIRALAGGAA